MTSTKCPTCKNEKDAELKYTRCNICGKWRELDRKELEKILKRRK